METHKTVKDNWHEHMSSPFTGHKMTKKACFFFTIAAILKVAVKRLFKWLWVLCWLLSILLLAEKSIKSFFYKSDIIHHEGYFS